MIIKALTNLPFLLLGLFAFFLGKALAKAAEEPEDIRHAKGEVTAIKETYGSSMYHAIVRFQADDGNMMHAMIDGLGGVKDADVGDEIEIDYYLAKNGSYYAVTDDPRYIRGSSPKTTLKQSRFFYGAAVVFLGLYVLLMIH
jgi:hypothetical protein